MYIYSPQIRVVSRETDALPAAALRLYEQYVHETRLASRNPYWSAIEGGYASEKYWQESGPADLRELRRLAGMLQEALEKAEAVYRRKGFTISFKEPVPLEPVLVRMLVDKLLEDARRVYPVGYGNFEPLPTQARYLSVLIPWYMEEAWKRRRKTRSKTVYLCTGGWGGYYPFCIKIKTVYRGRPLIAGVSARREYKPFGKNSYVFDAQMLPVQVIIARMEDSLAARAPDELVEKAVPRGWEEVQILLEITDRLMKLLDAAAEAGALGEMAELLREEYVKPIHEYIERHPRIAGRDEPIKKMAELLEEAADALEKGDLRGAYRALYKLRAWLKAEETRLSGGWWAERNAKWILETAEETARARTEARLERLGLAGR